MVKGVNRTVIEVNDTGSKMFERIVFYVTPQYGNLSAKQLRRAASALTMRLDAPCDDIPLRSRVRKKRRTNLLLICGSAVLIAAVGLWYFFLK